MCVCVCFVSWEDREILVGNWERSMNLMNSAVFWYFKQLLSILNIKIIDGGYLSRSNRKLKKK